MRPDASASELGTGADGNPIHVGDQVQTRRNTSELATSDQRRVLNRDVWTVVGRCDDGTVTAVHAGSRGATVQLTPEYLGKHTVLAYATTIAGAQGRTVDAGHAVVTPRTQSASLYVGMTRGRLRNHAHVVTDGHDHDELQLGHRSGLSAFAAAVVRNPDGETSATTVRRRWAEGQHERAATRRHDLAREKATTVVARHEPAPARPCPRRHVRASRRSGRRPRGIVARLLANGRQQGDPIDRLARAQTRELGSRAS